MSQVFSVCLVLVLFRARLVCILILNEFLKYSLSHTQDVMFLDELQISLRSIDKSPRYAFANDNGGDRSEKDDSSIDKINLE